MLTSTARENRRGIGAKFLMWSISSCKFAIVRKDINCRRAETFYEQLDVCLSCARMVKNNKAEKLVCGKRGGEDHLELPSKRRLVSKDDGRSSFSVVEAVCQPRQSQ